jgi:predicted glycoside hydrolase/deacetylase ChbG (UPF0249 family)
MAAQYVGEKREEKNQFGRGEKQAHKKSAEVSCAPDNSNFFLPAQFDQFSERFLPRVHFYDSHATDNLVHCANPFIRLLRRFHPEVREHSAHPTFNKFFVITKLMETST